MFTVCTFIGFTILVAVLSWWKTRGDDLSTKEGYFLAGRGLPGIVIAGSLMMTNLSAEQLVGTNGQSFAGNMSTMAWEATSAFALIVLAFVFLPKLLKGGIATIPEFFEMRYDTFTMRLFSLLFLVAYVVTMLPTILYSGAVALVKIFDIEQIFGISYFSSIALVCIGTGVIGMCYAVFGGLKAVAYSDTINGIGLIIGGFAIPILGVIALGQLDGGGFFEGVKAFHFCNSRKNERLVRAKCAAAGSAVAAAVHRHVRQQPVLLGNKPINYSALTGRQEPCRKPKGRGLGRLF